jgi:hypothetical protein
MALAATMPGPDLLARLAAARKSPIRPRDWRHPLSAAGKRAPRSNGMCKNDHEMTPENTGPGNVCRACKRDASRRNKEKKLRLRNEQEKG